ncbi:alkane 1-monooxygenase [Mycobacterium frederiksbergense]|uniref:Alkane 1-monooxygenase n=1 Tax=Mycolicibacterium frederiksbergense TaxID=117567 RepID=A0ABT6L1H2_9MYCO|nr:alkane 1-monooxygenase [Mycolicibacterium frederiksbergense]MDH6196800.1 alkane 1-monooxygenase [Mycolicibacterium frederiksbergense]
MPGLVSLPWLLVWVTDLSAFWWTGLAVAYGIIPLLDHLVGSDSKNAPEDVLERIEHDRCYRWATYCYLPNQYLALIFACWLWAGGGWVTLTIVDKLGLMVTVGIVGGGAINTAHELSHKRSRAERRLAALTLVQTGYAHFMVEHRHRHHLRVATAEDTTTSRMGENYYLFVPRSVFGGIRFAWTFERERLARRHKPLCTLENTILRGWLLCLATGTVLAIWFGPTVLPWLAGQAVLGVCVLESVNYVEHYGLRRRKLPDGRYERVNPSHSWNSNTIVANIFLYHLQRHSDQHANPMRRYQTLRHTEQTPLIPPVWRRVMDPRVVTCHGDVRLAGLDPGHEERLIRRYGPTCPTDRIARDDRKPDQRSRARLITTR